MSHFPVMLPEVLQAINPQDGDVIVDGTFGAGGYSEAFLERSDCTVVAIDQDPNAITRAKELKDKYGERFIFARGQFGDAVALLNEAGFESVDGFVLDIGVSSMQIDQAERGFSFQRNGPLDMRMDTQSNDVTAQKIVNQKKEEDLANIIYKYGEERLSRRIAKKICEVRKEKEIKTTNELSDIVQSVVPKNPKKKTHPATKTFQALRIMVNDELGQLEAGLEASQVLLKDGGRLVVVTFHSLEDGIVKRFLDEKSGRQVNQSRHLPSQAPVKKSKIFEVKKRKSIEASKEELQNNARSRSAKMRVAYRTDKKEVA